MTMIQTAFERDELNELNSINPYLKGIYAPVRDEVTALDLEVEGEIPKDLYGAYLRNGPNPLNAPEGMHHWFDGDGMVHGIFFENGRRSTATAMSIPRIMTRSGPARWTPAASSSRSSATAMR